LLKRNNKLGGCIAQNFKIITVANYIKAFITIETCIEFTNQSQNYHNLKY